MELAAGSLAIVPIVDRRERMTAIRLAGAGTSPSTLLAHVGAKGIVGVVLFVDLRLSQLDDPALPEFDPRAWIAQLVRATGDTTEVPARLAPHRTRGLRFAIGDAAPGSPPRSRPDSTRSRATGSPSCRASAPTRCRRCTAR